jgi:uncharacterized protein YecT (DUF1311 family)
MVLTPTDAAWRESRGDASCCEYAKGAGGMGHLVATRVHGHPAYAIHNRGVSMKPVAFLLLACTVPGTAATPTSHDQTEAALARCLDDPAHGSTAGQIECQARAMRAWDQRMNAAYSTLMKRLPAETGQRLRLSQRAWLAFRDADAQARTAFYATRQGTMYVPMQAASETAVTRDRAVQLEARVRIFAIDA